MSRHSPVNIIALLLILAAVVLFLIDHFGTSARWANHSLTSLGLALFAGGVALAAVWPDLIVVIK